MDTIASIPNWPPKGTHTPPLQHRPTSKTIFRSTTPSSPTFAPSITALPLHCLTELNQKGVSDSHQKPVEFPQTLWWPPFTLHLLPFLLLPIHLSPLHTITRSKTSPSSYTHFSSSIRNPVRDPRLSLALVSSSPFFPPGVAPQLRGTCLLLTLFATSSLRGPHHRTATPPLGCFAPNRLNRHWPGLAYLSRVIAVARTCTLLFTWAVLIIYPLRLCRNTSSCARSLPGRPHVSLLGLRVMGKRTEP